MNRIKRNNLRTKKRALRTRAKLLGTAKKPRLSVFRSNRYTYAQAIDDSVRKTIASASTRELKEGKTKSERAESLGTLMAKKAKEAGIEMMVFDKGPYKYHGRIKSVAEALRKSGIKI
ncbi:MAG: 50S ribosomal protein L18 [Parcubacteria group bacterium]